jgi:hypothetical protein
MQKNSQKTEKMNEKNLRNSILDFFLKNSVQIHIDDNSN